eukprot:TRINITY_DN6080_c0_g1_i19.p1 TRINITY_DN6080_c0_g1~~TRINITY_DN6080_c0_g1_i19.p1  ORF type:complete len:316 (+),score=36.17 TRINITY_DN6080_c0_g1_i19:61-1008(+)
MTLKEPAPMPKEFSFGSHVAEHMLEVHWNDKDGWAAPEILPIHNFSFSPFSKSLRFGLSSSDGFAAYKSAQGEVLLFRPHYNFKRFINSSRELFFPKFEYKDFIKCLGKLIKANETWIPEFPAGLFIKPLMFTEEASLTPSLPSKAVLTIITFPFKPMHGSGPIKLMLAFDEAKNATGGSGGHYLPANYAYGMRYLQTALNSGYQDVLWMDSEGYVTETNTSNFFMQWANAKGETELVTPSLRGSVLPGVTRDTLIILLSKNKNVNFKTALIPMKELIKAGSEKRVFNYIIIGLRSLHLRNCSGDSACEFDKERI